MSFYVSKTIDATFDDAIAKVTDELKKEGFGILTEVDVKETLKKKIDVDFRQYKILGACNPKFAHQALQAEDKIGVMLPCSIIVQEKEAGKVEIASMDMIKGTKDIDNDGVKSVASQVNEKVTRAINNC